MRSKQLNSGQSYGPKRRSQMQDPKAKSARKSEPEWQKYKKVIKDMFLCPC